MDDLARLLDRPGREIHCTDLVGASVEQGSSGEVLDPAARRQYEARIRELQEELDEAEDANDLVRAERAQTELDALGEHLSAAVARSGRTRRTTSSTERARSTVTQRIRTTIRRLEQVEPSLGRHLSASVQTGTWCSYRPADELAWTVER